MGAQKIQQCDLINYTLDDVAQMSGFSKKSIERFIREKKLQAKKVQGRRVITQRWYCEFMGIEIG